MPTCTRDTLISAGACFSGNVLSEQELKAREVWFMAKQLAAVGGEDFTADLDSLLTDANALTCGMSSDNLRTSKAVIEYNNAVAAGATVNTGDDLAEDVACLVNYPAHVLEQMKLLLRCQLGQAAEQ